MSNLSRQLENRNYLSPTGFKFVLDRSPGAAFFCNQANIPDINLGVTEQSNYLRPIPIPGEIIQFSDLNLRFLVDENLENYMEIQNWMRGLGFPENLSQYDELESKAKIIGRYGKDRENIYSDGTLQVLSSNLVPRFQISFTDLFPYNLSTLTFDATDTDIEYFTSDVSFKYTMYNITDLEGNPL